MRARVILLIVAILAVAGFASLNWDEFTRTAPLSFGFTVADASLGLIMLSLLALLLVAYMASAAMHRTQTLVETRHHYRSLESQRELAEKAEASRFTDLRRHMDEQLRDLRQHEAIAATEYEKAMVNAQRELRTQLEATHKMLMLRMGEFETRLDSRLDSLHALRRAPDDPLRPEHPTEPPARVRHPL